MDRRGIYVASKSKHGPMWKKFRDEDHFPIISTWIDQCEEGQTSSWSDLYTRAVKEASGAAAIVLFIPEGDVPKGGCFIEIGAALASGVPVFAFAPGVPSKLLAHPLITHYENLGDAIEAALRTSFAMTNVPNEKPDLSVNYVSGVDDLTDEQVKKLDEAAKRLFHDYWARRTPHQIFLELYAAFQLGKEAGNKASTDPPRTTSGVAQQYRKKPVVIEAIQFDGTNAYQIAQWSSRKVIGSPVLEPGPDNPSGSYLQIETLEGVMTADPGDWIIRGVKGEFYPCKPDIFEATYLPA